MERKKRSSFYDTVIRGWVLVDGEVIRVLVWTNYEQCFYGGDEKVFIMRIPLNDPRPKGVRLDSEAHYFLRQLEYNIWYNL